MFNCYGVMATQLTTFVPLYSCNIITLKMAAKDVGEDTVNETHHKHCSAICWLFIHYGPDPMFHEQ
jgi:hypothetical protein